MLNFIGQFFHLFLYQPLLNLFLILYQIIPGHDLGVAVIVLTVLVKAITLPIETRSFRFQQKMNLIQPRLKEIQEKYKDNPTEKNKALATLWQEEKINPFGGLLPLFIQLPILVVLYRIFGQTLWNLDSNLVYSFVPRPETINPFFFSLVNLSQSSFVLAGLAGLAQFLQARATAAANRPKTTDSKQDRLASTLQTEMTFLFPFMTVFVLLKLNLPSALALYWTTSSLLLAWQQSFFQKKYQS